MATVRLIGVLLAVGLVVLLGVQNLAPALPLVFFGGSTQALPLGVWLVGATLLGALTTLILTALLGMVGNRSAQRSAAYRYRPQSFYEPADAAAQQVTSPGAPRPNTPPPYPSSGSNPSGGGTSGPAADPSWRDWNNLKSPGQWSNWEALSQAPKPEIGAASSPGPVDSVLNWFSTSRRESFQRRRVNESMRELDDDWGDLENRATSARGVSPVEDTLDEIERGWGEAPEVEATQTPRRVYRDGSLYSYSYRGEEETGDRRQVDDIFAAADDARYDGAPVEDYGDEYPLPSGYSASDPKPDDDAYGDNISPHSAADTPLGEPEMAEDGVVDADYRVIEPPYAAEAAAATPWVDGSDDGAEGDRDEWDDADDALTP